MPTNTKFSQRNSAAGTGLKSNLMKDMMKSNTPSNAPKPAKTSGSNVKPSTTKTTVTKPMKTQNIPEVTVSVTKKTGTNTKPVTPPFKEKGELDKNVYIIRDPQNEYAYREVKRGTKGAQAVPPSRYEKMKGGIGPIKNK